MGLKAEITADIEEAIADDLADAFKDLIIEQEGANTRVNGEIVQGEPIPHAVKACEDNGSVFGENQEIKTGTKFFLFLQDHLNIEPELDMKLVWKAKNYILRGIRNDPADATWILKADLL